MGKNAIRLGFIGVGDQGSSHLDVALGIPGVEVVALCDVDSGFLARAKAWVEEAGQPTPRLYGKGPEDYRRLCHEEDLDAIVCSTAWDSHASICIEAMKTEKNAVCEVPLLLTLDEAWEIIETHESTGYWATLGLKSTHSALGNMIGLGMFGDIVYAEGGYIHDLRLVKFDPEREPWRLQHSVERNGNLYPDHPAAWAIPLMDINHGDRFDCLVSMSSSAKSLNQYARHYYGDRNYYANVEMKLGDYNATLIRTVNGKVFNLKHATNTPHPRGVYWLQGTKAAYQRNNAWGGEKLYFDQERYEEVSHKWVDAEEFMEKYAHPSIRAYDPPERKAIRGHSGGGRRTPYVWHRLILALQEGRVTDFDVYDSVTSSVIAPLTEISVADGSKPVAFPDFTKGKWQERPSLLTSQES